MKFTVDAKSAAELIKFAVNVLSGFYAIEKSAEVDPICRKLLMTELPLPLIEVNPILALEAASPFTRVAE